MAIRCESGRFAKIALSTKAQGEMQPREEDLVIQMPGTDQQKSLCFELYNIQALLLFVS